MWWTVEYSDEDELTTDIVSLFLQKIETWITEQGKQKMRKPHVVGDDLFTSLLLYLGNFICLFGQQIENRRNRSTKAVSNIICDVIVSCCRESLLAAVVCNTDPVYY
jgi:hypothetical protein